MSMLAALPNLSVVQMPAECLSESLFSSPNLQGLSLSGGLPLSALSVLSHCHNQQPTHFTALRLSNCGLGDGSQLVDLMGCTVFAQQLTYLSLDYVFPVPEAGMGKGLHSLSALRSLRLSNVYGLDRLLESLPLCPSLREVLIVQSQTRMSVAASYPQPTPSLPVLEQLLAAAPQLNIQIVLPTEQEQLRQTLTPLADQQPRLQLLEETPTEPFFSGF